MSVTVMEKPETDIKVAIAAEAAFVVLNATHRCDACSAAAVSQVFVREDLPLIMLCGHHHRRNMDHFAAKGYAVMVGDEHNYKFTGREIAARPVENAVRDAGSALA